MHKRTAHRWRLTALMAAGIFFALGSFWLVQVVNRGDEDLRADALKNEPDYIVERFSVVRMSPEGRPKTIVAGAKLTHRPVDDIAEVEHPAVQSLSADGTPPLIMRARVALIDNVKDLVQLNDKVDIRRAGSPAAAPMSLTTDALTLFPDEDRIETERPFELVVGDRVLTGVGMRANNATGQVQVLSKSRINFPPRAR